MESNQDNIVSINLQEDEIAIILSDKSIGLILRKSEQLSIIDMLAVAVAKCVSKGDKEFLELMSNKFFEYSEDEIDGGDTLCRTKFH